MLSAWILNQTLAPQHLLHISFADRRAHNKHLTNQTSRPNDNTPTPSPTAPTQAGTKRHRRKRKPRKTHQTSNLDTTSLINLSQTPLSNDKLLVLARGLTFCPTPKRINLAELSADINDFTRRMRLKEYFHDHNNSTQPNEHNPFHNKSSWTPPTDRDPALNTYVDAMVLLWVLKWLLLLTFFLVCSKPMLSLTTLGSLTHGGDISIIFS